MLDKQQIEEALTSDDVDDLYDAIIDIGKSGLREFESDVRSFLDHEEVDLKRAAIMALGTYWKLPDFKDTAISILNLDEDDDVRVAALINWTGYYDSTSDHTVIHELGKYIKNDSEDLFIRIEALRALYKVTGYNYNEDEFRKIEGIQSYSDFNKLVPWTIVEEIISNKNSDEL